MELTCCNSYLEVNLRTIVENARIIQRELGNTELIAVLKSDAYGAGAVKVAETLIEHIQLQKIAVAQIGEGIDLRKNDIITPEIIVMGATFPEYMHYATKYNLTLTVFDKNTVKHLSETSGGIVKIHIKINTGLNRLGVKPGKELDTLINEIVKYSNIRITGVFTHFADAEKFNSPLAITQLNTFKQAIEQLKSLGISEFIAHASASGASEWFTEANLDAVRIGRRLHMANPEYTAGQSPDSIQEALSWRTKITNIVKLSAGATFGYKQTFKSSKDTIIAIVGVGYSDGLLSQFEEVHAPTLVNGKQAQILEIAMDQTFVDVTDIECKIGDQLTFFGYSSSGKFLSAQYVASLLNQEGVNLTSMLSRRVNKVYTY